MENEKKQIPFIKKYLWTILFSVVVLSLGGYFGFQKYGSKFSEIDIFTKYPDKTTSPADTLQNTIEAVFENSDDLFKVLDTLEISMDTTLHESEDEVVNKIEDEIIEIVLENPIQKSPTSSTDTIAMTGNESLEYENDLFDDLIRQSSQSVADQKAFFQLYHREMLSSKTLFKIAAIAGKNYLQNESSSMAEMFATLEMEDDVEGFILCNKNGKIVYATNSKIKNHSITKIFPAFQSKDEIMNWTTENKVITQIPIYATFGKIGVVLITTKA